MSRQWLALAAAVVVGAIAAAAGSAHLWLGLSYALVSLAAIRAPAFVVAQVIAGQLLAALLLVSGAVHPLTGALIIALVILTAELLANREVAIRLRDAARTLCAAVGIYLAVMAISVIPGPAGTAGIIVAAAACVAIGVLATTRARA